MRWARLAVITAPLALVAGCAARSLDLAPDRPDRPWVPATDAAGAIRPGLRPVAGGDRSYSLPANRALGTLPAHSPIDPAHDYTLPELVDLAESANPETRIAWDEAKQAALGVGLMRSAYLPRLSASAAGIAAVSHDDKTLNGSTANGDGNGQGALAALSLQWLLFDFGERRAMMNAAEQQSIVANIQFDAAHQKIVHDVSVAFYAASSAREIAANAEQSSADSAMVEQAVEQRRARGLATVVEVAQARLASAQARYAAVQASGQDADARITLLTAVGLAPLAPVKLADIPYRQLTAQDGRDAAATVSAALARRPDMLAAFATEQAAEAGIEAARADFRPKVFLSAGASYQTGHLDITALPGTGGVDRTDNLSNSKRDAHAIIGVTLPLYDGGTRAAHLAQARARANGAEARFESVRDLAVRDIVVATTTVRTSVAAYAAADELLSAAQTSFDASFAAYRNGVGSLTEVQTAEISLMTARNARSASYSAALSAAANLALATGALSATPGVADQL